MNKKTIKIKSTRVRSTKPTSTKTKNAQPKNAKLTSTKTKSVKQKDTKVIANKKATSQKLVAKAKQPTVKKAVKKQCVIENTKDEFPHFRHYQKSGHPTLIVGEQIGENKKDEYKYRKVMHSERDGRHLNEIVIPNPKPTDQRPMYIAKRIKHDEKRCFGNKLPWKYPNNKKK